MQTEQRFIVTARKWRPQRFDALVGQEALAQALKHALQTGKTAHAYLFSGIRGVGKTSTARLLAKALNCLSPHEGEPCNQCESCVSINDGSAMDVIEIDGASNRGIDAIRELRETVNYMPVKLRYKVYIIDEVHMLTTEASNALLKTLEEPPSHVVFILATTEVHKLLPTIRSRCQHYVFKKIPVTKIAHQLVTICETEGYPYEKEALFLIAEAGDGSLRDAESIFDQVVIYTGGNLTVSAVKEVLGISPERFYEDLWKGIVEGDIITVLRVIDEYMQHFGDVRGFVWGMVEFLRLGLLVKRLSLHDPLVDMSEEKYQRLSSLFSHVEATDIVRMMQVMAEFLRGLRSDQYDRLAAELLFVQLVDYKNLIPLSEIRDELLKRLPSASGGSPTKPMGGMSPKVESRPSSQGSAMASSSPKVEQRSRPETPKTDLDKETKPVAASSEVSSQKVVSSQNDPKEVLFGYLQGSTIARQMQKEILSVDWDGTTLTVRTKAYYVKDFLTKASSKIAEAIAKACQTSAEIVVLMEDGSSAGKGKAVENTPSQVEVQPTKKEEDVSSSPASDQEASSETSADDVVKYAEDLFKAKKYP
ncbi:DNA polymerase III subunits gamma and tau [Brevinematales bacterium NS]|nr:DNA polymerase III subunits gamma and tau [Brevinematales bacterium NS]